MANDKTNNKNLEKRIKDILADVKEGGLTKYSIAMIVCLEDEIDKLRKQINLAESTIGLIKEKKVYAKYEGDLSKTYDIDQFVLYRSAEQ